TYPQTTTGFLYSPQEVRVMPHESNPLLLTRVEAARLLGVSDTTLLEWRRMGRIPYVRERGRIYYHLADLHRLQWALKEMKRRNITKRVLKRLGLPPKYIVHHVNGGEPGAEPRELRLNHVPEREGEETEERS
ncbi:MAG: helix-turn-helix domain-containing protein, partial [Myxococcaceae bacterium]|nr:helix-turn-helix domain-containing protein [Myxococcaceae bacterium]